MNTKLCKRLNPLNDFLFFKVMGEKGDEVQLLGFLNAVLGRTGEYRLTSVEILENKSFPAEVIGNKSSIFDVRAALHDGTRVNIEVQLRNLRNMDKRSLFYWSKEFTKNFKEGQNYRELPNVIAINIVNFEFLPSGGFHTVFHLREDSMNELILTNALEIHILDMVKYRRDVRKSSMNLNEMMQDPLQRWLAWFDLGSPPDLIAEVIRMDSAILRAEEKQEFVISDEDALQIYEMRQKAIRDRISENDYAREEGVKEGEERGKAEVARKMKKAGRPITEIEEFTGLPSATIEQIE